MSQYSAVDELQVFQLDEYQLPRAGGVSETRVLQTFEPPPIAGSWMAGCPAL